MERKKLNVFRLLLMRVYNNILRKGSRILQEVEEDCKGQ